MRSRTRNLALAAATMLAALPIGPRAARGQGEFVEMLWKVPESANAVVLIRAEEFLNAPIALREGWAELAEAAGGRSTWVATALR